MDEILHSNWEVVHNEEEMSQVEIWTVDYPTLVAVVETDKLEIALYICSVHNKNV